MNPWLPLVAATFGWASASVMSRAVLVRGVDAFTLVPIRMAVGLMTLLVIIVSTGRFATTGIDAWKRGLVLGTMSMALPMTLLTLGLEDLPVSLGGLLIALIPISTVTAAHFILDGERFSPRALPGLVIALAGTALLVGLGGETVEGVGDLWRGVGFSLAGVVIAGIGGALSRRFALQVHSSRLVLPQFTVNTIVVVAISPLLADTDVSTITTTNWLLLAGIGSVGTVVPFASFLIAAGINPASRLALVGYAVPVVGVAMAVAFLGETLTLPVVTGAVLILTGVVLTERATKHVPEPGVSNVR